MKITLPPETKTQFSGFIDEINGTIASIEAAEADLARMQADKPALEKTVAELEERTAHHDEKGVALLVQKKAALALLEKRIPLAQLALKNLPVRLYQITGRINGPLGKVVTEAEGQLTAEVAEALKPHFGDGPGMEAVVSNAPIVKKFREFYHREWPIDEWSVKRTVPGILEILGELIGGENEWTFTLAK